jgi:methyl-accepting chemotaxis protein
MKNRTGLERKMLTYFGLIAAASLLITVEFIYAIQSTIPLAASEASGKSSDLALSLENLRAKAILMFFVQAIVTLIVMIMFMRKITGPLQHMVESSSKIMEGDLSRTIDIRSKDEIGLLGETINGLTSNIQELVAYCSSVSASVRQDLDKLESAQESDPETQGRLRSIEDQLEGMDTIMEEFTLLPPPESETTKKGSGNDAS